MSQLIIITGLHAAEHAARVGGKCREIVSYHVLVGGHATEMAADIESLPSIDRLHQWRRRASRQIGSVDRCTKRQGAHGDNICYSQLARHQGVPPSVPIRDAYYVGDLKKAVTAVQQATGIDFGLSL